MTNIVYQAYGKKDHSYQTIFSIMSLIENSKHENFRIVIYTDKVDFLKNYFSSFDFIKYELLTPDLMAKWKGAINFNHRMKIEILKDCSQIYDGNILYLDGDTYFTKDAEDLLNRINEDQSVMHIAEESYRHTKDYLAKKIYKFLRKNKILVNGKEIVVHNDYVMWNAGVIGLHRKHHHLFQEIIDYTDALFTMYQKHLMEQHAVSYYLQKNTRVVPANDIVEHFWNQKDSFEEAINPFFEKNENYQSYLTHRNELVLPTRYYGKPRYTFKQKLKRKINVMKYRLGIDR